MTYPWRLRVKHVAVNVGGWLVVAAIMFVVYVAVLLFDVYVVQRLGLR